MGDYTNFDVFCKEFLFTVRDEFIAQFFFYYKIQVLNFTKEFFFSNMASDKIVAQKICHILFLQRFICNEKIKLLLNQGIIVAHSTN